MPRAKGSSRPLTDRQRELLEHFRRHTARHGLPPSVRDLGHVLGIQISAVHRHLVALARAGHLDHREGTFRLPGGAGVAVPVVSRVGNGDAPAAPGAADWVPCPAAWGDGRDLFAVRVRGDALRADGILEGDLVICARTDRAKPGDVVVVESGGAPAVARAGARPDDPVAGRVIGVFRALAGTLRG